MLPLCGDLLMGHDGIVRAYTAISMLNAADVNSCMYVDWNLAVSGPAKFTKSMAHIKPIVPKMRIGGKSFTMSSPARVIALNDTELLRPMVGMKNATDTV